MERDDPYERLSRRELYRNRWLAVEQHAIVHPSGASGEHVLVVTPPTAAVVAVDGEELVFARQPRFAARRPVVEIVKGGADDGESLADAARRELREELGASARRWSELGRLYEIPSIVAVPVTLFLACDLDFGTPQPESVETIAPVRLSVGAAIEAASDGTIDDAVTVAAIFRFALSGGYLTRSPNAGLHREG